MLDAERSEVHQSISLGAWSGFAVGWARRALIQCNTSRASQPGGKEHSEHAALLRISVDNAAALVLSQRVISDHKPVTNVDQQ